MPHVFIHTERANMIFVYEFCDENSAATSRECGIRFHNLRLPDSSVLNRVFNTLRGTGAVPIRRISSERVNEQTVDEVEDIIEMVECSPSTTTRRIPARIGVPKTRGWRTLRVNGLQFYHLQDI